MTLITWEWKAVRTLSVVQLVSLSKVLPKSVLLNILSCNVEVEFSDNMMQDRERAGGAVKGLVQPVEEIDAVRFRIYPDRIQQQVLKRWIGARALHLQSESR